MKFLIALSVLASSTVFANDFVDGDRYIKCYEPAQQEQDYELVYKLAERNNHLYVVHPFQQPLSLQQNGCLGYYSDASEMQPRLTLCPTQGQRVNGFVPVEATYGNQESETVYCDKKIRWWFERDMTETF